MELRDARRPTVWIQTGVFNKTLVDKDLSDFASCVGDSAQSVTGSRRGNMMQEAVDQIAFRLFSSRIGVCIACLVAPRFFGRRVFFRSEYIDQIWLVETVSLSTSDIVLESARN